MPKIVKYGSNLNFPPHYDHVSHSCYIFVHLTYLWLKVKMQMRLLLLDI